jgi:putative FmdB family regulatory protein
MPVYEYECQSCQEVIEIWQNLADKPVTACPSCEGQLKKIISMSSFRLKGGGWYADGYSSTPAPKCESGTITPACPKAKKACDSC